MINFLIAFLLMITGASAQTVIPQTTPPPRVIVPAPMHYTARCIRDFGEVERCIAALSQANGTCLAEYDKLAVRHEEIEVIVERLEAAKVETVTAIKSPKKRVKKEKK